MSPSIFRFRTIRAVDGKSAQLVPVRVLSGSLWPRQHRCQTLYDPLYYNHYSGDVDPFLCADREYRRDVAAYTRLSTADGLTRTLKYYGSYYLEILVKDKSRFVRLILIQKFEGTAMNKLNPQDFSLQQRQAIMKGILDVESEIYKHDVRNLDIHPRNVIVQNIDSMSTSSSNPEIVIIDFGHIILGRSYHPEDNPEEEMAMLPGAYISPRIRWGVKHQTHLLVMNFREWITWKWNAWLEREYKEDEVTDYMRSQWDSEPSEVWPPGCD